MGKIERTVITIADAKESALYFDYIIPVNHGFEMFKSCKILRILYAKLRKRGYTPEFRSHLRDQLFPSGFLDSVLPPSLVSNYDFRIRLLELIESSTNLAASRADPQLSETSDRFGKLCYELLRDYALMTTPVDVPDLVICDDVEHDKESDIAVTLPALNLIDAKDASWKQVLEFRRDKDAQNKLRRLRLFALGNYSGKSKSFIEDDISVRISEYQEAVRKWGFETKYAAFTTLLNSKILAGAFAGSLVSTLLGAPLPAVGTALVGAALEVGHITMEVHKRRFALRSLMAENPVCYISEARLELAAKD